MTQRLLVLVYGAGSGLGKSTLARGLASSLRSSGRRTLLFDEESARGLHSFDPYVQRVRAGAGADAATLLACCNDFLSDLAAMDQDAFVMDSLLPCWDWLHTSEADEATVRTFTAEIQERLSGFDVLLVVVNGDLRRGVDRAIADRGKDWALDLAQLRTGTRSVEALLAYFERLRERMSTELASWTLPVASVDTLGQDIATTVRQISGLVAPR